MILLKILLKKHFYAKFNLQICIYNPFLINIPNLRPKYYINSLLVFVNRLIFFTIKKKTEQIFRKIIKFKIYYQF